MAAVANWAETCCGIAAATRARAFHCMLIVEKQLKLIYTRESWAEL